MPPDIGYTAEEIKNAVRKCMARPDFDVIYEFYKVLSYEESARAKPIDIVKEQEME